MLIDRRIIWNRIYMVGIICIMINIFSIHSYAKTSFSQSRPLGIMSTAVKRNVVISWEPVKGAAGYQIYEGVENSKKMPSVTYQLVKQTKNCKAVLTNRETGKIYYYYVRAYKLNGKGKKIYSKSSKKVSTTVPFTGNSTIKNFLQTAIAPIGSTMYVWGGGWNKADTAAGKDAKHIGLSPVWRAFARNKKSTYNYRNYRYQIHNGLDCSGYVGWCVYNVFNTKNNKKGYVYSASKQAKKFAALGFGSYKTAKKIKDYRAGDIMSSTCKCCGHVWIVIGQCKDGSVVLVHSSPAGVQICGTVASSGNKNSKAYKLAKKYMKKYYKAWYQKYPDVRRNQKYLTHYGQMRWKTSGKNVRLSDPDGYQKMSAEQILADLFNEGQ